MVDVLGRIYAVNDYEATLRIDSVAIEKESSKQIELESYLTIPGHRGRDHGYVGRLSKEADSICRTPRAALQAYLALQRQKAEELHTELRGVESRIVEVEAMLAEAEEDAGG